MTIRHIISPWPTRVDTEHPWAKAHKPKGMSVDLHIHLVRFIVSQNHMVVEGLAHLIYMQVHNPLFYQCGILSHMKSISN